MKTAKNRFTSGLVFLASRHCDTLELSASLQRVLEANGHRISGVQVLSDSHVQVASDLLTLELSIPSQVQAASADKVTADADATSSILQKASLVIQVSLTQPPEDGMVPAKRATQATLASLTCQMAVWLEPDYIQWLDEDTLLDTKDFVKAVARVMPRRVKRKEHAPVARPIMPAATATPVSNLALATAGGAPAVPVRPVHPTTITSERPQPLRGAARFPDVDLTSRTLEGEYDRRNRQAIEQSELHELSDLRTNFYEDDDAELEAQGIASPRNGIARMATWFVAITVGIYSLPIAAFLMVYNLFRGEDFRLSAQALSLTGLFTALQANGATAEVISVVSNIIG
ncbi:hypothetical protein [Thalassovita sp.]|uniref:hypothetical protein n=1 Tax=Thalassovita sp. TaxID=1979401 RepID=UPI0029DE6B02|nr:hypothetical protein [Thalassovita sp.]